MPLPNVRIIEGGGSDGHFYWIMLLVGVRLNSLEDPDKDSSCWELVLQKEV